MGAIQIGFCSSSNLTTTVADWAVFDLPYIFSKTNANQTLFYDKDGNLGGPIFDRLNKQMLKKNIKLLWISPAAFRGIGVNKAGVKTLNDIKGMKIRCTASDVERDAIAAFGANPVAMGFGEIYTALQQKTLDGESLPPRSHVRLQTQRSDQVRARQPLQRLLHHREHERKFLQ